MTPPAAPSRCAACAGRWRATWRARTPRWCPPRVTDEADIGGWKAGEDVTMRLVRAIVAGCGAVPALNAHFLGETDGRVLHEHIDLGIATDTPDGLFVPVLRNVGRRDVADLRRGLERMKADVRARSVPREELVGATITLSNFGMFGGRHAQMVILPPQVAIVGAGRIRDDLRVLGGAIRITRVLPLSLTFDHRVVMGGEAARFLAGAGRRPRAARVTCVSRREARGSHAVTRRHCEGHAIIGRGTPPAAFPRTRRRPRRSRQSGRLHAAGRAPGRAVGRDR